MHPECHGCPAVINRFNPHVFAIGQRPARVARVGGIPPDCFSKGQRVIFFVGSAKNSECDDAAPRHRVGRCRLGEFNDIPRRIGRIQRLRFITKRHARQHKRKGACAAYNSPQPPALVQSGYPAHSINLQNMAQPNLRATGLICKYRCIAQVQMRLYVDLQILLANLAGDLNMIIRCAAAAKDGGHHVIHAGPVWRVGNALKRVACLRATHNGVARRARIAQIQIDVCRARRPAIQPHGIRHARCERDGIVIARIRLGIQSAQCHTI